MWGRSRSYCLFNSHFQLLVSVAHASFAACFMHVGEEQILLLVYVGEELSILLVSAHASTVGECIASFGECQLHCW